tara:strand:+ start:483 stop:683 length:201 start_codon:yes stop_codon:yes gene_type:complete
MFERLIEFFKELFNDDEIENNSDSDSEPEPEPEPKKSKKKTRGKTCRRTKISMKHSSTKRNRKLKK